MRNKTIKPKIDKNILFTTKIVEYYRKLIKII